MERDILQILSPLTRRIFPDRFWRRLKRKHPRTYTCFEIMTDYFAILLGLLILAIFGILTFLVSLLGEKLGT